MNAQVPRGAALWRLDDDPVVWIAAPAPVETGVDDAVRVTLPPSGATEYVARPLAQDRALVEVVEAAGRIIAHGGRMLSMLDGSPVVVNSPEDIETLRTALARLAGGA